MTDFEKQIGNAEWIAKQKLAESCKNLRLYIEKIANKKSLPGIVLSRIENNDYHSARLEDIYHYRSSFFGKNWMINDYSIFMREVSKIIKDVNIQLKDKFAGRAELEFQGFGTPNNYFGFGITLMLKINKNPNKDLLQKI